jgi:hypothetical protein
MGAAGLLHLEIDELLRNEHASSYVTGFELNDGSHIDHVRIARGKRSAEAKTPALRPGSMRS